MTPRQLDVAALHAKLRILRQVVDDLEPLQELTAERLRQDRILGYAVERMLTQLVDVAVAVNSQVAAAVLGRGPADYRESFVMAARAGAISEDLARDLSPSVGLRNVLTHEYVAVDTALVLASIRPAMGGFDEYVRQMAAFLASQ